MEGDQIQAHSQGGNGGGSDPGPQAHTQGGNGGGSDPGPHPRGKLRGIRSRPTPKGEIEGDQIQAHTQGGNGGGSDPGPHPRGKWKGIRSRPTPKGEIEGDQIQAPPRSRLWHTVNEWPVRILLECILVLQGSHFFRLTKFHDISMIFPGFLVSFQVCFSLFLKYDFHVVLNINMQTYWVSFEQKIHHFNYTPN